MNLRLPILIVAALALTPVGWSQERPVVKVDAGQIQALSDRMNSLRGSGWQEGFEFGNELAQLESPVGYMILRNNWNKGSTLDNRKQMFKGFVFNNHPDTLLVLNLGMHDPDASMQGWAMAYLQNIAFRSFADDFQGYLDWFSKYKAVPLEQVKKRSLIDALDKILEMPEDQTPDYVSGLEGGTRAATIFDDYPRLQQVVERLATVPGIDNQAAEVFARMFNSKSLSNAFRDAVLGKVAAAFDPDKGSPLLFALARAHVPGTYERIVPLATAAATSDSRQGLSLYEAALNSGESAKALPFIIGLLGKANAGQAESIVGALGNNLGIQQPHTDPAWWQGWWKRNEGRYRPATEADLPSFKLDLVPTAQYIPDSDDVKEIPSRSFFVSEDPRKRYLVSGKVTPEKTQDLLIVMPGGDGSMDFHTFVKRIYKHVLSENWVIAQPIAHAWDNDPNRVVWPSVGSPYPAAQFTTEEFLDGMVDEIVAKQKVKVGKVVLLAWSSSGPAAYSYLAHGKHPVEGAFIAMSVFRPEFFGDAKTLHAKRVFLLHSPQDFIPIKIAEAGKSALESLGVSAQLLTYEGGHGWQGPVWENMRKGLAYLMPSR